MGFTCTACKKHSDQSKSGIENFEGRYYVVCPRCSAENELIGTGSGPGTSFEVLGILERDKKGEPR